VLLISIKAFAKMLVQGIIFPMGIFIAGYACADKKITVGITLNNVGVDSYQTNYQKSFKDAAAQMDNVETFVLDAGGNVARQIAQMQDLIHWHVDVIIIWPTNGRAVIPAVRQAHKAGVPVVVTNSKIGDAGMEFIASFSGPDNVKQGRYAAEMLCEGLKAEGKEDGRIVQITGQPGYTTAIERARGFEDRLPEVCPEAQLVETQPGDWNREKSQRIMENFLIKYDVIDGVYAADDNMGVGALNAVKAADRLDEMLIVGATNFAVGYEAMERGEYYGSVYQSPREDARNALATAIAVAQGKDVPKLNYFDTPKITKKNMDQFTKPVF